MHSKRDGITWLDEHAFTFVGVVLWVVLSGLAQALQIQAFRSTPSDFLVPTFNAVAALVSASISARLFRGSSGRSYQGIARNICLGLEIPLGAAAVLIVIGGPLVFVSHRFAGIVFSAGYAWGLKEALLGSGLLWGIVMSIVSWCMGPTMTPKA